MAIVLWYRFPATDVMTRDELRELLREVIREELRQLTIQPIPVEEILNVEQVSALLNLAPATIYEKTSLKQIPHYKKGKKLLFKKSELIEWLESAKVDANESVEDTARQYIQSRPFKFE